MAWQTGWTDWKVSPEINTKRYIRILTHSQMIIIIILIFSRSVAYALNSDQRIVSLDVDRRNRTGSVSVQSRVGKYRG